MAAPGQTVAEAENASNKKYEALIAEAANLRLQGEMRGDASLIKQSYVKSGYAKHIRQDVPTHKFKTWSGKGFLWLKGLFLLITCDIFRGEKDKEATRKASIKAEQDIEKVRQGLGK